MDKERDAVEYFRKAVTLSSMPKKSAAEVKFKKSIALFSYESVKYHNLGKMLYVSGSYDQTVRNYKIAILLDPSNKGLYYDCACVLKIQQKYEESCSLFERLAKNSNVDGRIFYEWGVTLSRYLGKNDEACEMFIKAAGHYQNWSLIYIEWGNALRKQGKLKDAIEKYNKAISLNANSSSAYNNLGLALYDEKEYDKALVQFNKALEISQGQIDFYVNSGLVFYQKNNKNAAKDMFLKGLSIMKDNSKEKKEFYTRLCQEIKQLELEISLANTKAQVNHLKKTIQGMKEMLALVLIWSSFHS